MCNCDMRKSSVKLSLLIFCAYLQLGSCGMRLLRQLGLLQGQKTNFEIYSTQSPCPNIFEYKYDQSGQLYGFIEIEAPNSNTINLEVEFCVGNRVNKGAEGSITLPYQNNQEVIDNVLKGKLLEYRVNFPMWRGPQPKITKIIVNRKLICSGQPYSPNSVPILTTIFLRHKLEVNVMPLGSTFSRRDGNQNNFQFDNFNNGGGTDPIVDVRNENTITSPGNPYNFKPSFPKRAPEIVYKPDTNLKTDNPYSGNPFLNSLSTISPNGNNGGTLFNNFGFISPTTARIFPSISPQNRPTQTPRPNPDPVVRDSTSQYTNDVCGRPVVTNSLILNGQSVPRGAFPWIVAMFVKTDGGLEYQCTGTLVSKRHVVTAAHCVKPNSYTLNSDKVVLVMGRSNIQGWGATEGEKIIGADQLFVHPNYRSNTADADISVIVLKADVTFSKFIRPICLWKEDADLSMVVGKKGSVVGWGRDENGHKVSPEPKQIELPIVSQEQCLRSNYSFADITSERTFCAGDRNGSGPCNGDSGGGFVMFRKGRWHLKGIVSMSLSDAHTRTCDLSSYVVFTDASKYSNWLMNLIK